MRTEIVVLGLALAAVAGAGAAYAIAHSTPVYRPNGPQLRITVADGCPRSLGVAGDVRASGAPSDALVPAEPSSSGLVCSYRPARRTAHVLYRTTVLSAAGARTLGAALAEVKIVSDTGAVSCPADLGRSAIIALGYADRPDIDVWYLTTGCKTLDNGAVETDEVTNPSFYLRFERTYDRLVGAG